VEITSFQEIFQVIKRRIWMIFSIILGSIILAAAISYFVLTPVYQSSSQFIVNQQQTTPNTQFNVNDIRTNVELINTYNVIIKSPLVLEQVINDLRLNMSIEELEKSIQVNSAENSQVVTVTAQHERPVMAAQIANAVVENFKITVPTLINVDNVKVLFQAAPPPSSEPVKPRPILNMFIAFVIGTISAIGLALSMEFFNTKIKNEQEVERKANIPVLGVISHIDSKGKYKGKKPKVSKKRGETIGA
jgi:capsular polysaccharide biosynthesis protein